MKYDDDTLMAYADGELDPAQRAAITQAIQDDPELAATVARHQALRQDVFAAFAGALDEPVPERLRPRAAAPVHDLGAARVRRLAEQEKQPDLRQRRAAWPQWGALAASLAVGVLAGSLGAGWFGPHGELVRGPAGGLSAAGPLARALDRQLAQDGGDTGVRVGLSFVSRDGNYCRSFQHGASSGLACRKDGVWRVAVLADNPGESSAYRQAASAMPAAVLDAIDARIAGATLDAAAERSARDHGWAPRAGQARR